jgi:hypothetical protein
MKVRPPLVDHLLEQLVQRRDHRFGLPLLVFLTAAGTALLGRRAGGDGLVTVYRFW